MSTRDEVQNLLDALGRQAQHAHSQGRTAHDLPVTVAVGIEMMKLMLKVLDEAEKTDSHVHSITISKKQRTTGGPQ